jgi:DnaK suppressor protein
MNRLSREKVSDDQVQDPGDQATSVTQEELNISLANNERTEYDMLLKALDMLEKGTYGICTECTQAISDRRLQLYPNATRCLACQEAVEESL